MKKYVSHAGRLLALPFRASLHRGIAGWRDRLGLLWPAGWELAEIGASEPPADAIAYLGRRSRRGLACRILGLDDTPPGVGRRPARWRDPSTALVTEWPLPRALHVPKGLRMVLPIDRPVEEILDGYGSSLRNLLRRERARLEVRPVRDLATIDRLHREMLVPYAEARHGGDAVHLPLDYVRRVALGAGRLDLLVSSGEEMGCTVGYPDIRGGRRYWVSQRFGFPASVISQPGALARATAVANFQGLVDAAGDGFDAYDMGFCFPRLDDGNLQWKRRRGGAPENFATDGSFLVRLPSGREASFLWHHPLLAVEGRALSLHLGLPSGPSDDEVERRYREIGLGGLRRVYLHDARDASPGLVDTLRGRFPVRTSAVEVVRVPTAS